MREGEIKNELDRIDTRKMSDPVSDIATKVVDFGKQIAKIDEAVQIRRGLELPIETLSPEGRG